MRAILADANIIGQFQILVGHLESEEWRDVWASLGLAVWSFADRGLAGDASDRVVWNLCQSQEIVLITANRNDDGPDSLEATIRDSNTANSLPLLTIADVSQLQKSRDYSERVVERLLEILLDIDNYLGTGRLFLP